MSIKIVHNKETSETLPWHKIAALIMFHFKTDNIIIDYTELDRAVLESNKTIIIEEIENGIRITLK